MRHFKELRLVTERDKPVEDQEREPLAGKRLGSIFLPLIIAVSRPSPDDPAGLGKDTLDSIAFRVIVNMKEEATTSLV